MNRLRLLLPALLLGLSSCTIVTPDQARMRVTDAARASGATDLSITDRADGGLNVTGKLSGNNFALRVPPKWNGQTLLYAHGYVTPKADAREFPALVDKDPSTANGESGLLTTAYNQGYATANSEYAKIGYAVKEGIEATKALRDFLARVGSTKQYISGTSMGGNITVGLIEKYPNDFVGALSMCGVVSGWRNEMTYLMDFRVVYDYLTRGTPYALPGSGDALTLNSAYTQDAVNASVGGLFGAAGKGDEKAKAIIGQLARVTGVQPDPLSFIVPLSSTIDGLGDLLKTMNGIGYSNVGKVYAGSADDAALNAGVQRLTVSPESSAYLDANYTPTGKFNTKLLAFHNLSDPLVPYLLQQQYTKIVQDAGNSGNFVAQVVDARPVNLADLSKSGPTHCYFTPEQMTFAWNELTAWVNKDVRPRDGLNITKP